jgi:PTS system galactitol-specific IIA component
VSLASPLSFIEMGSQEKKIDVSLLFMLALKEPHEQLGMLQNLISMFQTPGVLEALSAVTTKEAYLSIIEKNGLQ